MIRHAFILLCLVGLLAPAAAQPGQPPRFEVEGSLEGLVPGEAARALPFVLAIPCASLENVTRVDVRGQGPAWVSVSVEPASFPVDAAACEGDWRGEGRLDAQVPDLAPAFEPDVVLLEATSATDVLAREPLVVSVTFVPRLRVDAPETTKAGPADDALTYVIRLENQGNAPLRVTFEVEAGEGLTVVPPPPVILASPLSGEPGAASEVRVVAIKSGRGSSDFEVRVVPAYAFDAQAQGETTTLVFTARAESGVPGPSVALLLAGLAAAAVLARRARAP